MAGQCTACPRSAWLHPQQHSHLRANAPLPRALYAAATLQTRRRLRAQLVPALAAAAAAPDLRGEAQQILQAGSQRLQELLPQPGSFQLPALDKLQPSGVRVDVGPAPESAAQLVGAAAQGLAAAAQAAVAPLDVFGNGLLDLMFWAAFLLIAYSVVVLGPRQ